MNADETPDMDLPPELAEGISRRSARLRQLQEVIDAPSKAGPGVAFGIQDPNNYRSPSPVGSRFRRNPMMGELLRDGMRALDADEQEPE